MGNLILVTVRTFIGIIALLAAPAAAQTSLLDCAASPAPGGRTKLTCKSPVLAGRMVRRATMLAHLRTAAGSAEPPPRQVVVNGRATPVTRLAEGWISLAVRPEEALKPVILEGVTVDGAGKPGLTPYLAVELSYLRKKE